MNSKKWLLVLLTLLLIPITGRAQADQKTLFLISNTHLDTQWNWEVNTTIDQYVKNTLTQNMALMDKYPYFRLNYEGAIKYMWMKEYYPAEYEKMKGYIRSGQWHVSGLSVDANDVMISSAESILRNFLYANKFYMQEFGVRGGHDIMLPDCFGFSYALPSLAHHAGIKGFHSAKLAWGSAVYDKLPPFGIWQGVDGSQIYAIYKPGAYDAHEDFNKDMTSDATTRSTISTNYSRYGVAAAFRYVGPRSDRGGGLKDDASSTGENTPYWLNLSASKTDGAVQVKMATPDECFDYLDTYRNNKYPIWNSELPMRTHGVGSYTSKGELKRFNRKDELLADAAEKAGVLSDWLGVRPYPNAALRDGWIRMLWQQHHDGITGTSTLKAYDVSHNEYYLANKIFGKELTTAIGAAATYMDTQAEGMPIVVYNPLSFDRTDVVEGAMACTSEPEGIRVYGPDGNEVLAQVTSYDEATGELHFLFAATVPSLGYAVYDARPGKPCTLTSSLTADGTPGQGNVALSNGLYTVTISDKGNITTVEDLTNDRTLLSGVQGQLIYDHEDTWPAWEISYTDVCRTPSTTFNGCTELTMVEDGPLRKSYRIRREVEGSTFVEYIRMSALSNRIDCVNEVDWQTHERMMKMNFKFKYASTKTTYDISLGTIQRGVRSNDEYEVQGHQWADNSNSLCGVSILNDCKYGWDKPNTSTLRLTLLHTPSCGQYEHQADMDIGPNHFTYAIFPHQNGWSEETQQEASRLNQPLIAFVADKHDGPLGKRVEFVSLNTGKVSIKALKKAEESDEYIVRVYEWTGQDQENVRLTFPTDIVDAHEVNALEEHVGDASFSGCQLSFAIGHYQPKTFALRLKSPALDKSKEKVGDSAVILDHNLDMMSYDKSRGNGYSAYAYLYPAELVPDTLTADGVAFVMGSHKDGDYNALRCSGQTIPITPQPGQHKLYLLLASGNNTGSNATLTIGGQKHEFFVPYFSGNAGEPLTTTNLTSTFRTENIAFTVNHAHQVAKKANESMRCLYLYKYRIDLPENVTEFTLTSSDRKVMLFAATLSDNSMDDVQEFTPINTTIGYDELGKDDEEERLTPNTITASHQSGTAEAGKYASDLDPTTKWCVTSSQSQTPYLQYNFREPVIIKKWMVLCAARESGGYIAPSFKLQYFTDDKQWKDVDTVKDNQSNKVLRTIDPVTTTRVRLQMVKGERDGYTTRIYEFGVYGCLESQSGIDVLTADGADDDASTEYFNVWGMPLDAPHPGINLIRKDGKVTKIFNTK